MVAVFYRLWAMSLQASLLILIVLMVRFFLSRYPRIYSYCLWILVGVRLLCPLWVESSFSLQPDLSGYSVAVQEDQEEGASLPEEADEMQAKTAVGEVEAWTQAPLEGQELLLPTHEELSKESEGQSPGESESAPFSLKQWWEGVRRSFDENWQETGVLYHLLLILYPCGVVALMLFYLGQYIGMRRRVSTAVCEKGNVWLSDRIASPFVMGVIFPKIYLPYRLEGPEKKHVLRHERTHIRHQDPLIRVIGILCICLHWWNPLVWLAVHRMNQDMEMFCDETVLSRASLEERKAYARTLLAFAEKGSSFGTGLAFVESHTEKRVKNIMKKRKRSLLIVCLVVAVSVFCVVALLTVPRGMSEREAVKSSGGETGQDSNIGSTDDLQTENHGEGSSDGNGGAASNGSLANEYVPEEELAYLMKVCTAIPDFSRQEDMDRAFWENYLFAAYTSDFEREQVNRYSQQYEEEIPYIRVGMSEADNAIRRLFGKNLSEYGVSPESLGMDNSNLVYEDGFLYVAASDSPDYVLTLQGVTSTDILTEVTLLKMVEDNTPVSQVMLYLLPEENEWGFRLDGKEEILIPAVPDGQILAGQSFEVEMNPYGRVTFAAYAPDLSQSPYADVTFKLLRDGAEIYSFPLNGTGVRQDESVFDEMGAVAFPDLNGDGYTDVVTIAHYKHAGGPIPSQARIFTYNPGGYFLEEQYLAEAYNRSHEEKTIGDIEAFAALRENQDYYARTSIYGRWKVSGYKLPGIYALTQEEIDSYASARLEYGNAFLWTNIDGETQNVDRYEKSTVTMDELAADFRINSENLELAVDELEYFQVETEGDSLFGHFFYLVDSDHALIYYEGVFFEAVRE